MAVAVDCATGAGAGAGALATAATGLAVVVVAVFATGTGAAVVVEVVPTACGAAPLAVDAGANAEVPATLPPLVAAGAHGAALAVFVAAGAAVFFFPNNDPKLEIAAAALETAVFVPAGG